MTLKMNKRELNIEWYDDKVVYLQVSIHYRREASSFFSPVKA